MSHKSAPFIAVRTIGIDLGKNSFHLVGLDQRGAIVLRLKCSRAQLERRLANIPSCLVGMEACSGAHYIGRQLAGLGHDVRLMPAQYVKPFLKGHKNDYRDAEAIAEAVQRPTMHFVAIKTPEQMDLLAQHRVRSRLVGQRTGVINQIRGFLIERGITVRQGVVPLRKALPDILSSNTPALSPRMVNLITGLVQDWRRLDERIAAVSAEIESLAKQDESCQRVMTVPGIGPIISSAVVAAISNGAGFTQGRDFGAWLGLVPKQESTGYRTGQDLQARQQISTDTIRAGRTRRAGAAAKCGDAGLMALDRAGVAAAPSQHAGDRARQQARPHRLGGSRARALLSAEDRRRCRVIPARSGSPKGCPPPLSATVAHHRGRASDGGSEGMASRDRSDGNDQNGE
jgi:transposase